MYLFYIELLILFDFCKPLLFLNVFSGLIVLFLLFFLVFLFLFKKDMIFLFL